MLIDTVIQAANERPNLSDVDGVLKTSLAIRAHNVADYIFQSDFSRYDLAKDFPNIAPPAADLWIEWSHKSDWGVRTPSPNHVLPPRFAEGIWLSSLDFEVGDSDFPAYLQGWRKTYPRIRWITYGTFFLEIFHRLITPVTLIWGVTAEGEFHPINNGFEAWRHPFDQRRADEFTEDETRNRRGLVGHLVIPFMTLSFLHCKNVRMNAGPPWPDRLQKARMKHGRAPLVRWHVLTIDPVKSLIASANRGDPSLNPQALHICRGHFKDFTEKGLFGRFHGRYWWPMHIRGSAESGVVLKDYAVKAAPEPVALAGGQR